MHRPSVVARTILALVGVLALASCGTQQVTGSAAPASSAAVSDAKPTISEAEAKTAYDRLKKMRIACTLVTPLEFNVIGVETKGKGAEFGEECNYNNGNNDAPSGVISLAVMTADRWDQSKQQNTTNTPLLVRTDTVDGFEVFSLQAKPKICFASIQRADGAVVTIGVSDPTPTVDCDALPPLAAVAMSRLPKSF